MKAKPLPKLCEQLDFEYRGIRYRRTERNIWIFLELPPRHPYRWSRFFDPTESGEYETVEQARKSINAAIDRAHAGIPWA